MLRLCCCPRRAAVTPSPAPGAPVAPTLRPPDLKLDLVADLPPLAWDSSAPADYDENDAKEGSETARSNGIVHDAKEVADGESAYIPEAHEPPQAPARSPSLHRSPSIRIEDCSERSNPSRSSVKEAENSPTQTEAPGSGDFTSQKSEVSLKSGATSTGRSTPGGESTGSAPSDGKDPASAGSSGRASPAGSGGARTPAAAPRGSRDVRTALAECIVPARHEDWEAILAGLLETERLAADPEARASPSSWRGAARATAAHVRSLRSRVARAACCTLGALYEHRGRALEPELEEAAAALLERCADANRFLRADAGAALARVACGGSSARAVTALCRRGAAHRAGPVRAAAAAALARLVAAGGAARALELPPEARSLLLRAVGSLLGDASAEARLHARALCLALAEDARFHPLLKEATPPSRYRTIEKLVDKLR